MGIKPSVLVLQNEDLSEEIIKALEKENPVASERREKSEGKNMKESESDSEEKIIQEEEIGENEGSCFLSSSNNSISEDKELNIPNSINYTSITNPSIIPRAKPPIRNAKPSKEISIPKENLNSIKTNISEEEICNHSEMAMQIKGAYREDIFISSPIKEDSDEIDSGTPKFDK